jgi:hypothetical protein
MPWYHSDHRPPLRAVPAPDGPEDTNRADRAQTRSKALPTRFEKALQDRGLLSETDARTRHRHLARDIERELHDERTADRVTEIRRGYQDAFTGKQIPDGVWAAMLAGRTGVACDAIASAYLSAKPGECRDKAREALVDVIAIASELEACLASIDGDLEPGA